MKYYVLNHYIEEVRAELNKLGTERERLTEPEVLRLSMKLDRLLILSQRLKRYNERKDPVTLRNRKPSRVIRRERQPLKIFVNGS